MCHIFEKGIVQGYQKRYSHVSNAQIHKYKYTNIQIQHMMKYQKNPICGIFLKRGLFKGIKNYIPMCQMHKGKIKCQKDPTSYGIFLKKGDCSRMSSESRPVVQGLVHTGVFP